ncbi:MAG TPA: cupin domain-containing protein [Cyclobacteriaceae bacterium]|nr:cupin domain-containing protein [Cyclobacteriaceae bacterium]
MLYQLKDMKPREVFPGFSGRFIHTEHTTHAYWEIASGSALPIHHHIHEQIVHVLEGEFELVLDGVPHRLTPGTVLAIPTQVPHSGRAITPCKILDVFSPKREDYQ